MSEDVKALQQEYYEAHRSPWFQTQKILNVLAKISASGHQRLISTIMPLLWAEKEILAHKAADTISQLLQSVPIQELFNLDVSIRGQWSSWETVRGLNAGLVLWLKNSRSRWWVFAALASHPSGYVRQAALEELKEECSGDELPFILLRTTDWVQPVRESATGIFGQKLKAIPLEKVTRCLPLVFRMRNAMRHNPKDLIHEIERLGAASDDFFQLNGHSPAFLAFRFQIARLHGHFPLAKLIEKAAIHPSVSVRLLACEWISEVEVTEDVREKYGRQLLSDSSPIVRARAFWKIANAQPEKYAFAIENAMMDGACAVQDTARGAWRLLLHRDALSFYRNQLIEAKTSTAMASAIYGLGGEGTASDEGLIRPFLTFPAIQVRKRALQTLVNWGVPDTGSLLESALLGQSSSYCKAAAALMRTRPRLLTLPLLKELLLQPRHMESSKVTFWLLPMAPKWSALTIILLGYSIPQCRDRAMLALSNWNRNYNRQQTQPTGIEAREAVSAFLEIGDGPLSENHNLRSIIGFLESVKP